MKDRGDLNWECGNQRAEARKPILLSRIQHRVSGVNAQQPATRRPVFALRLRRGRPVFVATSGFVITTPRHVDATSRRGKHQITSVFCIWYLVFSILTS